MTILIKKHYMLILAPAIFILVFLYQLFKLLNITVIQSHALQELNYLVLVSYIVFVVVFVSFLFNIPLLISIELIQSINIPNLRVGFTYKNYLVLMKSMKLIINRYRTFSVYRC